VGVKHGSDRQQLPGMIKLEGEFDAVRAQLDEFSTFFTFVRANSVKLVLCQKGIHPAVSRELLQLGALPIARLGLRHIHAAFEVTGCRPLSAWSPEVGALGNVSSVKMIEVGGKQIVLLHPSRRRGAMSSLVVTGQDECTMEEVELVTHQAVQVLKTLVRNPYVVHGGGAFEAQCEKLLSQQPPLHTREEQEGFECVARTLVEIGARLAQDMPKAEAVMKLKGINEGRPAAMDVLDNTGSALAEIPIDAAFLRSEAFAMVIEALLVLGKVRTAHVTPTLHHLCSMVIRSKCSYLHLTTSEDATSRSRPPVILSSPFLYILHFRFFLFSFPTSAHLPTPSPPFLYLLTPLLFATATLSNYFNAGRWCARKRPHLA